MFISERNYSLILQYIENNIAKESGMDLSRAQPQQENMRQFHLCGGEAPGRASRSRSIFAESLSMSYFYTDNARGH